MWKILFFRSAGSRNNPSSSMVWPNIASQVTPLARPANRVHSGYFLRGKRHSDHGTFASGAPEGWRWAFLPRSAEASQRSAFR
ncbi:hypothetical protein, partial [Candidatus Oscillochloris fontis]|uniref:hypothetical protein n=1 Tax=Candidatus Oscillochloris fontis TaxID=2496868 RepID=UPI001EE7E888